MRFLKAVQVQFLITMKEALGDDYTSEVEKAWNIIFASIASRLIEGINTAENQYC